MGYSPGVAKSGTRLSDSHSHGNWYSRQALAEGDEDEDKPGLGLRLARPLAECPQPDPFNSLNFSSLTFVECSCFVRAIMSIP